MKPDVRVIISFDPHKDDISELYETVRSACETMRPFGINKMDFLVTMRKVGAEDEELSTF